MTRVTCSIAISLDGYVAGPDQSLDDPIGVGGMHLHEWMFDTATWTGDGRKRTVDDDVIDDMMGGVGAYVMGRNMFGADRGPWDESWRGWWGEEPPYHAPVFVLTHHPREPLTMQGATTFTFLTDGFDAALDQARAAAGGQDVSIAGGASAVRQALAGSQLDELYPHIVGVVLGAGAAAPGRGRSRTRARRGHRLARGHPRALPRRALIANTLRLETRRARH